MTLKYAAALSMAALLVAGAARAEIIHYQADLTGPNGAKGTVTAELEPSEKALAYRATYSGLSGPATMAHFHGPADPGKDAPPVVTVPDTRLPIGGSVRLNDQEIADLEAGKWYFNVHTAANPGGEIRGQLKEVGR
jgi:CHRD domain